MAERSEQKEKKNEKVPQGSVKMLALEVHRPSQAIPRRCCRAPAPPACAQRRRGLIFSPSCCSSAHLSASTLSPHGGLTATPREGKKTTMSHYCVCPSCKTNFSPQTFHAILPRKRRRWLWFSGTRRCCLKTDISTPRLRATWDQHALTWPCWQDKSKLKHFNSFIRQTHCWISDKGKTVTSSGKP